MHAARGLHAHLGMPSSPQPSSDNSKSLSTDTSNDSPRMQALIAEIAERLAPVCPDMPADSFAAMGRRAAEATSRWETGSARMGKPTA